MTPNQLAAKIGTRPPITTQLERNLDGYGTWSKDRAWYTSQKQHWLGRLTGYRGPGAYGGTTLFIRSESGGSATGTEGTVRCTSNGGGEFCFHWDNPFAGVKSYAETAPTACGLCFSDGTGNNAVLDLHLVPPTRVSAPLFFPSINGFQFGNPLAERSFAPPRQDAGSVRRYRNKQCLERNLRRGMAYSIADYYEAPESLS